MRRMNQANLPGKSRGIAAYAARRDTGRFRSCRGEASLSWHRNSFLGAYSRCACLR